MSLEARISGGAKSVAYDVRYRVPEIQKTSARHATNKAMRKVYVETIRGVSKETGIPQLQLRGSATKGIARRIIHNEATKKYTRSRVWIGTAPVPLTTVLKNKLSTRKAPAARLFNQYTTEGDYGKTGANAFAAEMKSGKRAIFVRAGKARLPIKEVKIRIHEVGKRIVKRAGARYAQKLFDKEFLRLSKRDL